eukprot:scaffold659_cov329-Prasinococcus_capsulatus_cf.AAC.15
MGLDQRVLARHRSPEWLAGVESAHLCCAPRYAAYALQLRLLPPPRAANALPDAGRPAGEHRGR